MVLVDSHCHLPLLEDEIGIPQALKNAKQSGVAHMLCVSIDLDTFPSIRALARQYEHISASLGVHPNSRLESEPGVSELVELAEDDTVVAIGETGLDYFRSEGDLQWQRQRFRTHIRAAKRVNKPLIIHTREAKQDVIQILEEEGAEQVGGVMHCFVEDIVTAEKAMALNFYISFSGIVTFKNAQALQQVARQVPMDRILIETDSPYLAPVPYRGKTNQPAYLDKVAGHLADLRGVTVEAVARATTDNFFRLFDSIKPLRIN